MNRNKVSPLLSISTALALTLSLEGCGDSFPDQVSGQPAGAVQAISDPIVDILRDGVDESLEGAAPAVAAEYLLTFSETSNAATTRFTRKPSSEIIAILQPNAATRTSFRLNILNKSRAGAADFPFLDLQFGQGNSQPLAVGTRLSANSNSSGPRAQLVYGETFQPPRLKLFVSQSGQITVTGLTPGAGQSGSIRLRFDNVVMTPRASGPNTASGSFTVNGEASFTF